MEISLQEKLNKLLNAYSHQYDIDRDVEVDGFLYPATATYYLRDENYLISKKHVLSAVEQHEYLYFYLTDHLTAEDLQSQIDLSKRAGLGKVKPHKDHMFSNVGLGGPSKVLGHLAWGPSYGQDMPAQEVWAVTRSCTPG